MNIAIGSDHAGFEYKEFLKDLITQMGYQVKDCGADSTDSVDYPDFAHPVAEAVSKQESKFGVLVCGSGNGVAMSANKHKDIRAALCWNEELAALARQHNDANILCVPARFISQDVAQNMLKKFLSEGFEGGRHQRRVEKIACS